MLKKDSELVIDFRLGSECFQIPLHQDPFHQWVFPDGTLWTQFFYTKTGYLLRFPDLADFHVSKDGLSVSCIPVQGVTESTAMHLYLNQVRPLALSKRGKLVFHASAIDLGDSAISFMAESGRGKSTLAASFAVNGYPFLTDDGLVLEPNAVGYLAHPSQPSIRLWKDSEQALIPKKTKTAPPLDFTSKSRFLADEAIPFCNHPRPLRRIYFLGDGSAQKIFFQPMTSVDAHIELVKHSFLLDVRDKTLLAKQFQQISQHSNKAIYYHLDYPRDFDKLSSIRQAIMEHSREEL